MKHTMDEMKRTVEHLDGVTVETIHPGPLVFCDDCGDDWTERTESGGILFQSKALCPECAPKWERNAAKYGEQRFIRGRCPQGKAYADWVREDLR